MARQRLGQYVNPDKLAKTFIFRGQADACRDPIPLVFRRDIKGRLLIKRELANRQLELFAAMLRHEFSKAVSFDLDDSACLAMAQHYQLPTHMLDFTTDPCVAVQFAATGLGSTGHEECDSVVFSLNAGQFYSAGINIVLPPPISKRLYMQRGLFIVLPEDIAAPLFRSMCREVRFPREKDFPLYRNGSIFDVLSDEPLLREIVRWTIATTVSPYQLPTDPVARALSLEPIYEMFKDKGNLARSFAAEMCEQWKYEAMHQLFRVCHLPNPDQPNGERILKPLYLAFISVFGMGQ